MLAYFGFSVQCLSQTISPWVHLSGFARTATVVTWSPASCDSDGCLLTCGRDEKGGTGRLHPLGHGEVGQVGEGNEEGEGGDTVCYGHQEVGGDIVGGGENEGGEGADVGG